MDQDVFEMVKEFMENNIPFNRFLGMRLVTLEQGRAVMELPFRPELIGDPFRPALHGGVISTLLDTCGGAAVFTTLTSVDDRTSTVDLRVDYLRPGRQELLRAEARIVRAGNRVAVVDLCAYHPGGRDKPVATGTGVYNIRRAGDRTS
ncbi:MAG: thioesterase family protein [Deltaproteobacteria bacterium]|nr:MAG: thioesterase family protein [Deltaproteobacteria bacterium]